MSNPRAVRTRESPQVLPGNNNPMVNVGTTKRTPTVSSPPSIVNISGGTFNHIEGDYNVFQSPKQGLDTLLQHTAPEAMHNSEERYPPPMCHPDTRKDILAELTAWIKGPPEESSILWLHAPAGHGKSAVMQTLTELLSSPTGTVVANYFFGRGKGKREQARYLFPTIAYQLALHVPGIRDRLVDIILANPLLPANAMKYQVESLIVGAFPLPDSKRTLKRISPFTIIIDGLDECSNPSSQQLIIELLGQIVATHRLPLRFLIASRPEPHILEVFNKPSMQKITRRIGTLSNDFKSRADIKTFLRHGFSEIYSRKSHLIGKVGGQWPSEATIQYLCNKSCGQFIYATTVLKFVDDRFRRPGAQLNIVLSSGKIHHKNVFSDLDSLYFQVLSTYPEPDSLIRVLRFIAVVPKPVSAAVYEDLLDLPTGEVELILQGLHSLLNGIPHGQVQGDVISIRHASFQDFLTDKDRSGQYYVDTRKAKSDLVTAGLSLMSRSSPNPETLSYLSSSWLSQGLQHVFKEHKS
ncbi:hypothetical protein GALMADRAFT_113297 [Galerina marginata CBS 339.88]|uniref:Nephrocystin 3-like N-terminal domain-containing protein n=1 Tax=Galerina marginata (strain CBS 339.88) TaxID=685588 RepID=A0A067TT63_GALM3|nr:hypothetical protein GALMADRAFT_113297 [Galerina marginata CBS 339.88]